MTDSILRPSPAPSTPAGPPSAGGGRHLKRLSLSLSATGSSPGSSSSFSSSPLSARGTGTPGSSPFGSSPTVARGGHAPRHLRLSMSGSPSSSFAYNHPPSASASASASTSGSTPRSPDVSGGPSNALAAAFEGTDSPSASPSASTSRRQPPWASSLNGGSSTPLRAGHARRQFSISYSNSSSARASPNLSHSPFPSSSSNLDPNSPSPFPGPGSPSPSFARSRTPSNLDSPSRSSSTTSTVTSASTTTLTDLRSINTVLANSSTRLREEDENSDENEAHASNGGFLSPNRTGAAMGAQPTLTEVNADLLSFIAKKERKCLDLREELKRNEDDLAALKRKWEGIVAKSLASSTPPTTTSLPRPGAVENARKVTAARAAAAGDIPSSPTTSNPSGKADSPPKPTQPLHTLDLSLLSSTFDSSSYDPDGQDGAADIDKEIGESVQAAKAWMGGVFGKVLEAVQGTDDGAQAAASPRLDVLREEEEEEAAEEPPLSAKFSPVGGTSDASATSDERRDSHASTMSDVSHSSTSSFGFSTSSGSRGGSTASGSTLDGGYSRPLLSDDQRDDQPSRTARGPPAAARSHNRRQSAFDMLGSAVGGGWGSIGKRWNAVAESEVVKSSKRATLNLVDNLEKTLTETLGPLDPPSPTLRAHRELSNGSLDSGHASDTAPPKSPGLGASGLPSGAGVFASWSRAAPTTTARDARRDVDTDKTPKSKDEFDWSAFLDDKAPSAANATATSDEQPASHTPKLGGYRRPSHAKARTMSASPQMMQGLASSLPAAPSPRQQTASASPKVGSVPGQRKAPSTVASPKTEVINEEKEGSGVDWAW